MRRGRVAIAALVAAAAACDSRSPAAPHARAGQAPPAASPSPEPAASPSPQPAASPSPSPQPAASPSPQPAASPSPSPQPAASPSPQPAASPSPSPASRLPEVADEPPPAHGDHHARHGGAVFMDGPTHFEVVLDASGRWEVHFSDVMRRELPASYAASVTITVTRGGGAPEPLPLAADPTGAFWTAAGKPIEDLETKVRVEYLLASKGEPYVIDLRAGDVLRPTAGPHGGLVAVTPHGRLELVVERTGAFKVWLLDAAGRPRAVDGASGRVRMSIGGYPPVTLGPSGDHLVGMGPPLGVTHTTAIVTVERPKGVRETARFGLHLDGHAGGHGGHAGHAGHAH